MSITDIQALLGSDVIVLVGAPLCGKGTQGKLLGKVLDRPYVSSGDLFRAEVASGSALGQQIHAYMESGELIPNDLTTEFLTTKLSDKIYHKGMILDGYPRNLSHLPLIDNILINLNERIFTAIYLDVPKTKLNERRAHRGRTDDGGDTFEHRYAVFQDETVPLIDALQSRNQLIKINCDYESPEEINQRIISELSALCK
ncbi:unnamed protein product [Rotaria magnacalcarata]|uniref:Adenylate kinase n=2 Tax=Rotaria magnacalcarata TaxID=392030 RepID=A0A815HGW7_9BILA|nr:unnamed protein product [Rotaria magnacalcarata]CAF1663611.1 unnamed protein product [Rotaria magnacalcarata]CAF1928395.1 unnamed protein product [Rotaria magnacalcarata]CAF3896264.1 unnamed protein product [Rotaria magnacalcarata]